MTSADNTRDRSAARSRAAQELLGAYRSGVPVAPLTARYAGLTVEDAYAIQLEQIAAFVAAVRAEVWRRVLTPQEAR